MVYFILSCARSGSTSLSHVLNTATNGSCLCEPSPNLNIETRNAMDGKLKNSEYHQVIKKLIVPRINKYKNKVAIYGEKNVTYAPFIQELYKEFDCKFVFLKRDGRDVVRSLINWHNEKFGDIYLECKDPGNLAPAAQQARKKMGNRLDTSDYSRPRPSSLDPIYKEWKNLSRFEMCSWYWSHINDLYLDNLSTIPKDRWVEIDYSSNTENKLLQIQNVFEFLGLSGFSRPKIKNMLGSNINSLKYRGHSPGRYPHWSDWSKNNINKFNKFSSDTMIRLGYYKKNMQRD